MRLVRSIVSISFVLLVAARASAGPVGIHPGFKVGMTVANLDGNISSAAELESRSEMTFGGTLRLDLGPYFSLQPEIQYVPTGGKGTLLVDNGGTPTPVDGALKLDYLEVPILAKFRLPGSPSMMPNLYLGPTAALNLASKLEADLTAVGGSANSEADLKDQVESLLLGGAVGGGFDLKMGKGLLTLDARYSKSFSEMFKAVAGGSLTGSDPRSNSVTVTLGYSF
ncbi:MAG TPA: porin family protein [Candidatus Eisenbacteria bacterium]|nr:porin family protein [Candidatus Eisenbacteria bacterium]